MINPDAAQMLAQQAMQDYVNGCQCGTTQDVANALMKFASVIGLGMVAVCGQAEAVARMQGTTDHIAKPQFSKPFKRSTVQ